jgi:hypothetical protein
LLGGLGDEALEKLYASARDPTRIPSATLVTPAG